MIDQAMEMQDPETKEGAVISIGRLMKSFFNTWNKDSIEDKIILQHIRSLSNGKLDIDLAKVEEFKLFDSSKKEKDRPFNRNDNHRRKGQKRKKRRN